MRLFCICKHMTHALIFSDSQYISESLVFEECLVRVYLMYITIFSGKELERSGFIFSCVNGEDFRLFAL